MNYFTNADLTPTTGFPLRFPIEGSATALPKHRIEKFIANEMQIRYTVSKRHM